MPFIVTEKLSPSNEIRITLAPAKSVFLSLKERAASFLGVSTVSVVSLPATKGEGFPLNLTFVPNSEPSKKWVEHSHKRTAFGRGAVTRIYNASGAMDKLSCDPKDFLFLTATLPGDTEESKWGIAEYSHEIVDGLKSWLSKRLVERKEFYVWENQKRGALHFHYCIYCPEKSVQESITSGFKREMVRLYDAIQKKHHCNLWGKWADKPTRYRVAILQARVEVVYKSVGAYMAGYLGGKGNKHSQDANHSHYPRRWFGVSRPLSAVIKEYTHEARHEFNSLSEAGEFYEAAKEHYSEDALTANEFKHKFGVGKTSVNFHTPEKQSELWLPRNPSQKSMPQNQNYNLLLSQTQKLTLELQSLSRKYRFLVDLLPPRLQASFLDSTLQTSLRNGVLAVTAVEVLERMYCASDLSSSSIPAIRRFSHNLRQYNILTAKMIPYRFRPKSEALTSSHFDQAALDRESQKEYVGTNTETVDTPATLDGSRGHVPSELGVLSSPKVCQTSLFQS